MKINDTAWAIFLLVALFAGFWLATESVRTMTLVCVKVVADREGLQQALEQCK